MERQVRLAVVTALALLMARAAAAQPDADRYIKLGTRLAPLPNGEGGQLRITAPAEWCKDARHLLEVRLFTNKPPGLAERLESRVMMPVVRIPAGPSVCDWTFDGLPAGLYGAVMQTIDDEQIVATGSGSLAPGTTLVMTLEARQIEVEGLITSRRPLPAPLRLAFHGADEINLWNRWEAPVNSDGTYRVVLRGVDLGQQVCVKAEADGANPSAHTPALGGSIHLGCRWLSPGAQPIDFEHVDNLRPGVIHIEVPPLKAAPFTRFAQVHVSVDGALFWFKPLRGLRTQMLVDFGTYTVSIVDSETKNALVSANVTVGPEHPARTVRLTMPSDPF